MQQTAVRSAVGWVVLTLLLIVIAFQLGALDYFVKHRMQDIAHLKDIEWLNQWYGVQCAQYPQDLQIYQNLVYQIKPDIIIETGTSAGGNALFLATLLEQINSKGKVITIDIDPKDWNETLAKLDIEGKDRLLKRIVFIEGSSTSPEVLREVANQIPKGAKVLVMFDSDHSKEHVLQELKLYSPLVTVNSYLIVNDTQRGPPLTAVKEFLATTDQFVIDPSVEKFAVSCAHSGFLKRVK